MHASCGKVINGCDRPDYSVMQVSGSERRGSEADRQKPRDLALPCPGSRMAGDARTETIRFADHFRRGEPLFPLRRQ